MILISQYHFHLSKHKNVSVRVQDFTDADWKVWSIIIFEKLTSFFSVFVDQLLVTAVLLWAFRLLV